MRLRELAKIKPILPLLALSFCNQYSCYDRSGIFYGDGSGSGQRASGPVNLLEPQFFSATSSWVRGPYSEHF